MQCKCKYNISIVSSVSVCLVNKIALKKEEKKKSYFLNGLGQG